MNTKVVIRILFTIVFSAVIYLVFRSNVATNDTSRVPALPASDTNVAPLLAEENAVFVSDQKPGTSVTGTVILASPGYLVIHEDNAGELGIPLGASALLEAGENRGVVVTISRAMKEGEALHAVLHTDADGNGTFDASVDTLVQSKLGGPIRGIFNVSKEANPEVEISL